MRTSRAVVALGGAGYVNQSLGLLRGLLYTRALAPEARGGVQLVFLIAMYLAYAPMGIYFGLEKKLPLLIGAGESDEAEQTERTGMSVIYLLSALAAAAMWVYAALAHGLDTSIRLAVAFGGIYLIFSQVAGAYRVCLRSRLEFSAVAASAVYEGLLLFVLVVAGSYWIGAPGTMAGWALAMGIVCLYLLIAGRVPALKRVDLRTTLRLVRTGLPVLGAGLTGLFVRTADNLVVAKLLGYAALGHYGLAWTLASYLYNAAGAADAVLTPRIYQAHGKGDLAEVRDLVLRSTKAFAGLLPVLSGAAAIFAPIMLRIVLPKYTPAIPPFQVFCFTVTFMAIPMAARTVMVAVNREFEMMAWDGSCGLLIAGAVWYLIHRDPSVPLYHISLIGGAGLFVSAYCITIRALQFIGLKPLRIAWFMLTVAAPFAYCVLAAWVARLAAAALLPNDPHVVEELIALLIFAAIALPVLWWTEHTTHILATFRKRQTAPRPL
jgi:O-antigen/teichoic acid export membrane protein